MSLGHKIGVGLVSLSSLGLASFVYGGVCFGFDAVRTERRYEEWAEVQRNLDRIEDSCKYALASSFFGICGCVLLEVEREEN